MMITKFWMVFLLVVGVLVADTDRKDYNRGEHSALCALMREAVRKWGNRGEGLSEPLKAALRKTIFGDGISGETVDGLKEALPVVYQNAGKGESPRSLWCGDRHREAEFYGTINQTRWPGYSASHDMVCLCTVGHDGWPYNKSRDILCGRTKDTLKGGKEGWCVTPNGKGKEQIEATWKEVVKPCLQLQNAPSMDLQDALRTFKKKIEDKIYDEETYNVLGENGTDFYMNPCGGSPSLGLCVQYHPEDEVTIPLWKKLENAINQDEEIRKKHAEDEARKQQQSPPPDVPHTETLKSSAPPTKETAQTRTESLNDKILNLNITSWTPVTQSCSWLLSAVFFIKNNYPTYN